MAFDIEGARREGYSEAEIADFLASQSNFDVGSARKEGYSDAEIMAHLSGAADPEIPQPSSPEQLASVEAERTNRPFMERTWDAVRQKFLMGGATDVRNVLGSVNPSMGPTLGAPGAFTGAARGVRESLGFAARNPTIRESTLATARGAGYVVPPSAPDSRSGFLSRMLESIVGKANTQQAASVKNQEITNRLTNRAIGLADDAQLTPEKLEEVRKTAGRAYEVIKTLPGKFVADSQYLDDLAKIETPFSAASREFPRGGASPAAAQVVEGVLEQEASPRAIMEQIQLLRKEAKSGFRAINNPEATAKAKAQWDAAKALEGLAERNLSKRGNPELLENFRAARAQIAKTHDIELALNLGSGDISAARIAGRAAKSPLSGELETIAKFRQAYPKATQDIAQIGSMPTGSPLDAAAGAIVGATAGGGPGVATAMARPVGRRLMEALVLRGQQPGVWEKLDKATKSQILVNAVRSGQMGFREAVTLLEAGGPEE